MVQTVTRKNTRVTCPFKLLALDIADDDSIESFGKELFSQIKQVDVLINNAGYLLTGLAEETSVESGRQQLETNFWGTVKLTNELLPHFRKKRNGKIITIGSIIGNDAGHGGHFQYHKEFVKRALAFLVK